MSGYKACITFDALVDGEADLLITVGSRSTAVLLCLATQIDAEDKPEACAIATLDIEEARGVARALDAAIHAAQHNKENQS